MFGLLNIYIYIYIYTYLHIYIYIYLFTQHVILHPRDLSFPRRRSQADPEAWQLVWWKSDPPLGDRCHRRCQWEGRDFLWDFYGIFIIYGIFMGFLWDLMGSDFSDIAYGIFYGVSMGFYYGISMGFKWDFSDIAYGIFYGVSMGFFMGSLWDSNGIYLW